MTKSATAHGNAETHHVLNQPQIPETINLFSSDRVLSYWHKAFEGGQTASAVAYGSLAGGELYQAGFDANRHKPEFQSHDRFGYRLDQVNYHPSYHQLMGAAIAAGLPSGPWLKPGPGAHVNRAAMSYLHTQADPGSGCPLTMTFASVPAISGNDNLSDYWLPRVLSSQYDGDNRPYFEKRGVTIGMAMTEKQGGSDVRANTSVAEFEGDDELGQVFRITGHKWFCSAPMCDAFLVLAQTTLGVSCFLMPRWKPNGEKNSMQIQRLKNKVGNCSNASSEVEFRGAFAWLLGEQGKGVRCIIDMVALTRFDCIMGSAALMRGSLTQALLHSRDREAFGQRLIAQPLMKNVLADLCLESEAAVAMGMRLAKALDQAANGDIQSQHLVRLGTAIGKYWVCKRAPQFTYEAMESVGGVGYVEDNATARNYREAPVNAIWEGSGNVQCLDVLRAVVKEPEILDAFWRELAPACEISSAIAKGVEALRSAWQDSQLLEFRSRQLVEDMALLFQASVLTQWGDAEIARYFTEQRLAQRHWQYGTLDKHVDCDAIIDRAMPHC